MLEQIFERIDFGALSTALLYGDSLDNPIAITASYEERLKEADRELAEKLGLLPISRQESFELEEVCTYHKARIVQIYFELGMKAGIAFYRKLQGELPEEVKAIIEQA